MPHISNSRKGTPNTDRVRQQEIKEALLKDNNTRSLTDEKIKATIKHLNEAVLWLLEHQS